MRRVLPLPSVVSPLLFHLREGNPNSCGPEVSVSVSFALPDQVNGYKITQGPTDPPYLAGFQVGNCSYDFTLNLFDSLSANKSLPPERGNEGLVF